MPTGSIGAARNKAGLQKAGIHFIVNASPVVPCFHGGTFHYKSVNVYDDHDEDIAQYFAETNSFIDQVWPMASADSYVCSSYRLSAFRIALHEQASWSCMCWLVLVA